MEGILKISQFITRLFPLWVVLFSLLAFFFPDPLKPMAKFIPYGLGIIMLGMGLSMKVDDFKLVLSRPKDVFWGIVLRYMIMPFVGYGVATLLGLPPALAAGLILVGCCPSGTASNVMTFLAKGDTALSVTVSSFNTVLAPVLTPFMFLYLAGSIIPINTEALLMDIVKIVLVPVALGIGLRTLASDFVDKIMGVVPVVSVVTIVAVIAHLDPVAAIPGAIFSVWHNLTGSLLAGFWGSRETNS